MTSASFSFNPGLYPKLRYDSIKDFTPVSQVVRVPHVIVVLPWNLAREISEQLAYTAEWGARLVVPIPTATASRSRAASSRPTAAGCGSSRTAYGKARPSASHCPARERARLTSACIQGSRQRRLLARPTDIRGRG